MTLTIELDLDIVQVDLHVKFLVRTSNCSVVRVLTDRQTDGSNSMTSTADAGGKNKYYKVQPPSHYHTFDTGSSEYFLDLVMPKQLSNSNLSVCNDTCFA